MLVHACVCVSVCVCVFCPFVCVACAHVHVSVRVYVLWCVSYVCAIQQLIGSSGILVTGGSPLLSPGVLFVLFPLRDSPCSGFIDAPAQPPPLLTPCVAEIVACSCSFLFLRAGSPVSKFMSSYACVVVQLPLPFHWKNIHLCEAPLQLNTSVSY